MPLKNTVESYGSLARGFHWLMALMVIGMLGVGLYMVGLPVSPDKFELYGWHKSAGALLLGLAALRLAWRLVNIVPKLPDSMRRVDRLGAHLSHYGLYALLFAMPLSGWGMSSAAGFPVSVFGWFTLPNLVQADNELRALLGLAHEWMAYALIGLIMLHASAALWHHFVRRDDILRRML